MKFIVGSKVQISQDAQFCPKQSFSSMVNFSVCAKISFQSFLGGFEDAHLSWYSHGYLRFVIALFTKRVSSRWLYL
jgi:hypothetical protein